MGKRLGEGGAVEGGGIDLSEEGLEGLLFLELELGSVHFFDGWDYNGSNCMGDEMGRWRWKIVSIYQ